MGVFVQLHNLTDLGVLVLRLAIAAVFLVHGNYKWAMWKMQPTPELPAPMLKILRLLSICEPLGGVAMVLGFLTQLAALGLGIIMVGAIYTKRNKMKVPFAQQRSVGWEFDLILLAACVLLFFSGAGSYAIDSVWIGG